MLVGALVLSSACTEHTTTANFTGINLRAEWLRTLPIAKLPFSAVKDDGTDAFTPGELDPKTATGTSAIARTSIPIILTDDHVGEKLTLGIEGLAEDGTFLASGTATATLRLGELFPMTIRLDLPTECGDGAIRGIERCDDANTLDDDGCSPTCTIEQGWICVRSPSICFPESMTGLATPTTLLTVLADDTKPYVIMRAGTYTDPLIFDQRSRTIVAEPGTKLEVTTSPAIHLRGESGVGILGLEIRGGGILLEGINTAGRFAQMVIGPGPDIGIETRGDSSLRLERTIIKTHARGGLLLGGGLYRIDNTIIQGNGSATSAIGGVYVRRSLGASSINHATIVENVVATGSSTAAGVHCAVESTLANDIVWANGGGAGAISTMCRTAGCDLSTPGGTPLLAGAPSISEDPKLTPTLRLQPDSPCIDQGDASLGTTNIDLDGDPRPAGDAPDIGADEAR